MQQISGRSPLDVLFGRQISRKSPPAFR